MRGFGTAGLHGWMNTSSSVTNTVELALEIGYRHFDTAPVYGNERAVGKAFKCLPIHRESLFVASKVAVADFGFDSALYAFESSIKNLGLEYIDLYLLHWPIQQTIKPTWQALEHLVHQGVVKSIGVSNFTESDLVNLFEYAEIKPVCNQIELHPHLSQKPIRSFCKKNNIAMVSWSPLGTAQWRELEFSARPYNDPLIIYLSEKYGISQAQVILRWHYQNNLISIPKSDSPQRIKENFDIDSFEIAAQDMRAIDDLNRNTSFAPEVPGIN